MATNEWGMLRDILNEVAAEHEKEADGLGLPYVDSWENARTEAEQIARLAVAHAFRHVADKMTKRGGMTPDELAIAVRQVFPRPTKDV